VCARVCLVASQFSVSECVSEEGEIESSSGIFGKIERRTPARDNTSVSSPDESVSANFQRTRIKSKVPFVLVSGWSAMLDNGGEYLGDGTYMEQEEEWEREGLLDPAWEKQQKKVLYLYHFNHF